MNRNLYLTLARGFADQPDSCCLRQPGGEDWSFRRLDDLSGGMAATLLQQTSPGDRVLVQVDKCPEAVALYLACLRAGLVLVPLNTAYTAGELDYFRGDSDPAVEIDDAALAALAREAAGCDPLTGSAEVSEDDIAAILYTSGTTGRSKGAMLSHGNLASNALTLHELWGFEPGDVLLHALPIYHVHGLFVAMNTALLNGSTVIFLDKFEVDKVLAELPRATIMMGVPTYYTRLLADPAFGPEHCLHMRLFISGSAPLTEQTFAAFEACTGHRILERYGMSETGMISSNPLHGERVAGTVGFALPGVELRVCDDNGALLPSGEVGVVEVRGPNVFRGYWQMPEKTAAEFREDGFFITGDLGQLDAERRLRLVGREKDLVISGGLNVYPKEVELCLDAIDGIRESAVIGLPHPDFGEVVVAVCVPGGEALPEDAKILDQLQGQLAKFKQPKVFIQVDALPRNTMGKVQKNTLRDRYGDWFRVGEKAAEQGSVS
jgi:malonyl-CoA/methylmalonyl-CoA synthetase